MNARTFGKKGMAAGATGPASRRGAFLTQERARDFGESRAAETEVFPPAETTIVDRVEFVDAPDKVREPVGPRSLRLAWALWFVAGMGGLHRLYLARYATGLLQGALFVGCFVAIFGFQRYPAYLGLVISWLWMLLDGMKLKQMHAEAVGTPKGATVVPV